MPKTAYLAKHLSSSELKEKYLQSQNSVETRRWHLVDEPLVNQYFERIRVEESISTSPLSSETERETFASLGYSMCLPVV